MGGWGDGEMVRKGFEKGNAYRTVFGIMYKPLKGLGRRKGVLKSTFFLIT